MLSLPLCLRAACAWQGPTASGYGVRALVGRVASVHRHQKQHFWLRGMRSGPAMERGVKAMGGLGGAEPEGSVPGAWDSPQSVRVRIKVRFRQW